MDEELKEIEEIKKIPKDVLKEIDRKAYYNTLTATIIMAVCVLFLIGFKFIEPIQYIVVLRVCSVIALIGAISMIEIAYKKDSAKLALNAVEIVVIGLGVLSLPYLYTYNIYNCPMIAVVMASLFGVYYAVKGIVIIYRERKKYRQSKNDIKDITK